MDEMRAREIYWDAVNLLKELITDGERTQEDILEELENDLN